jgi:hypothetical protein
VPALYGAEHISKAGTGPLHGHTNVTLSGPLATPRTRPRRTTLERHASNQRLHHARTPSGAVSGGKNESGSATSPRRTSARSGSPGRPGQGQDRPGSQTRALLLRSLPPSAPVHPQFTPRKSRACSPRARRQTRPLADPCTPLTRPQRTSGGSLSFRSRDRQQARLPKKSFVRAHKRKEVALPPPAPRDWRVLPRSCSGYAAPLGWASARLGRPLRLRCSGLRAWAFATHQTRCRPPKCDGPRGGRLRSGYARVPSTPTRLRSPLRHPPRRP